MANVRLEALRKVYDNGFTAVHDVSLDIADGEFVVLVGPSGCGKSTTLRMIAGLERITGGRLWIDDRLVNDVAPSRRDLAMVFQNYALYPHMSVYDNMGFALRLSKLARPEIDRRIRDAAAILGITEILDRKPRQLSGGQRQRVAVGRAIVRQPRAFLFDEPLSNLDAKLRVQTRKEISRLHRQLGTTMIYVTHDQVEAMTMADRIVLLDKGHVQQVGTPLELYQRPSNRFVAGFIGSPAMNLVPGTVRSDAGAPLFSSTAGAIRLPLGVVPEGRFSLDAGREVVLGIRPEDIYLAGTAYVPQPSSTLDVQVDVVEPMGNEVFLYANAGGEDLVARIAPHRTPRPEERVQLALDLSMLHFFDAATGLALRAD